jgi:hypothetical protein
VSVVVVRSEKNWTVLIKSVQTLAKFTNVPSAVLELLHANRRTDRKTESDMVKLTDAFLQLLVSNAPKERTKERTGK